MLTKIHIQNFRTCKDVLIADVGPIIALVGPNGSGKSNILQALSETGRLATLPEAESLWPRQPATIELDFKLPTGTYSYRRIFPSGKSALHETLSRWQGMNFVPIIDRAAGLATTHDGRKIEMGRSTPCLPTITALLPKDDPLVLAVAPALSFLSAIRYYPVDEPAAGGAEDRLVSNAEYLAWVSGMRSSATLEGSIIMRIIDMWHDNGKGEMLGALRQLVGSAGLGLIDHIAVSQIPVRATTDPSEINAADETLYYRVFFVPRRGANGRVPLTPLTYDSLSSGTRRVLRIFTSMLYDGSSVMLLEQPEDSLHQGLIKKVIGLLRQNAQPAQLIMSSHSSALLNTLKPDEIRLVSLQDGFTVVRKLDATEMEAACEFMNEQGPLYDFLETVQEG